MPEGSAETLEGAGKHAEYVRVSAVAACVALARGSELFSGNCVIMKTLRVFVASPNDVHGERDRARSVLLDLPQHKRFSWLHVQAVLWDDRSNPTPLFANRSGQDNVNADKPTPAECDLTIVIVHSKLGTAPFDRPRAVGGHECRSGTEWEYRTAIAANKRVLVFHNPAPPSVPLNAPDIDERRAQLDAAHNFIREIKAEKRSVIPFSDTDEFAELLQQQLESFLDGELRQQHFLDAVPLQRASVQDASPPTQQPQTTQRIRKLRLPIVSGQFEGREALLDALDEEWHFDSTRIVSLIGVGGAGKSTLLVHWINELAGRCYDDASCVLAWSFYRQGVEVSVSSDEFLAWAFKVLGAQLPTTTTPIEKGESLKDQLTELSERGRVLLVLDGLEVLQVPPGDPTQGWKLGDAAMSQLLRALALSDANVCVVLTTRVAVADLDPYTNSVARHEVEQLEADASVRLLRELGVTGGTDSELEELANDVVGHPLSLTLLGKYIANRYQGDISRLADRPLRSTDAVDRIISGYVQWFGNGPEVDLMRLLALIAQPIGERELRNICNDSRIVEPDSPLHDVPEDAWADALARLREARLIVDSQGEIDAHPLVRAHFSEELRRVKPEAWKRGHSYLSDYFERMASTDPSTGESREPSTEWDMKLLYGALRHRCQAERWEEAAELLDRKIRRGDEAYSIHAFGMSVTDRNALRGLFLEPWSKPQPALSQERQAWLLAVSGFTLKACGQLREATTPLAKALGYRRTQRGSTPADKRKRADSAAQNADYLAMLYLTLGDLREAEKYAKVSLESSLQGTARHTTYLTSMGAILHHLGRWKESERLFQEAESQHASLAHAEGWMHSFQAFRYCDLLLDLGRWWDALPRAHHALTIDLHSAQPLSLALDRLSLGRAQLLRAANAKPGGVDETLGKDARKNITRSVLRMREAGRMDVLPNALLAAARMHRLNDRQDLARRDLNEILGVADRQEMPLHEADAHLELAKVELASGKRTDAQTHFNEATRIITERSYGRRASEVEKLKENLGLA